MAIVKQAIHRKSYRWTDDDVRAFDRLGAAWGGIRPLPESEVIREAVRRCLEMTEEMSRGTGQRRRGKP